MGRPLSVHGFVLAGGQSSRMGRDKALLPFCGHPLITIALEKLRGFCCEVTIAGNRDDLAVFAPVVHEKRIHTGPAAGLEAGLEASSQPWSLFIPVDVPLLPEVLLQAWTTAVLDRQKEGVRLSFLRASGQPQPVICLMHKDCAAGLGRALEAGERKLGVVFHRATDSLGESAIWSPDAEGFAPRAPAHRYDMDACFSNVNTPDELSALELWVRTQGTTR